MGNRMDVDEQVITAVSRLLGTAADDLGEQFAAPA